MARPKGVLSMTYHMTFTNEVNEAWLAKRYDEIFDEFDIDEETRAAILNLNLRINVDPDEETVRAWLELLYRELADAPSRLW